MAGYVTIPILDATGATVTVRKYSSDGTTSGTMQEDNSVAIGDVADTAWAGTGDASLIAALKAIALGALDTSTPVPISSHATAAYFLPAALGSGDKILVTATDNKVALRLSAATVRTSPVWVQLFNANAAADVTLGTTVPTLAYQLVAGGTNASSNQYDIDYQFPLGIVIALTTTAGGSTGVTAGDVTGLVLTYK